MLQGFILYIETPTRGVGLDIEIGGISVNTDQKKALQSLKTAKGQIEATIKMLEEGRYCVDVSNQILAAQSLLKKADLLIIRQHIDHCVRQAFSGDDNKGEEKLDEVMDLLAKVIR